jgi:hypothetical protein
MTAKSSFFMRPGAILQSMQPENSGHLAGRLVHSRNVPVDHIMTLEERSLPSVMWRRVVRTFSPTFRNLLIDEQRVGRRRNVTVHGFGLLFDPESGGSM